MLAVGRFDRAKNFDLLVEALHADQRPLMIISDRPRRLVRTLSARAAGTMLLTGAESDAGYRVALAVCEALSDSAQTRRAQHAAVNGGAPVQHAAA